jgi:hypothetical protein
MDYKKIEKIINFMDRFIYPIIIFVLIFSVGALYGFIKAMLLIG